MKTFEELKDEWIENNGGGIFNQDQAMNFSAHLYLKMIKEIEDKEITIKRIDKQIDFLRGGIKGYIDWIRNNT